IEDIFEILSYWLFKSYILFEGSSIARNSSQSCQFLWSEFCRGKFHQCTISQLFNCGKCIPRCKVQEHHYEKCDSLVNYKNVNNSLLFYSLEDSFWLKCSFICVISVKLKFRNQAATKLIDFPFFQYTIL